MQAVRLRPESGEEVIGEVLGRRLEQKDEIVARIFPFPLCSDRCVISEK